MCWRGWLGVVFLAASAGGQMILSSPAFRMYEKIPADYGCDTTYRDDYRPSIPLEWTRVPVGVRSFVLMMDDMDNNGTVLWLVKDIPRSVASLPRGASEVNMPKGAIELTNSRGFDSFSGPCPDFETMHSYRFRLFAMPAAYTHIAPIIDPSTLKTDTILSQIQDKALYVAVLVGTFYLGPFVPPPSPSPVAIPVSSLNATIPRNTTVANVTEPRRRPVNGPIPTSRFVKPSEVLKPRRPHGNATALPAAVPCSDPADRYSVDVIVQEAAQQAHNQSASATAAALSTQLLVDAGVASFQRAVDLWACEDEFRRNAGVRVVGNTTEACSLRLRVTDASCADPVFPRQFVCATNGGEEGRVGLSPSLMWRDMPEETQSLVLMVEESSDLDYVRDYGQVFWLVTNVHPRHSFIEAGASGHSTMPPLAIELKNSFGISGYTAPCPGPHDRRMYRLRVFAMPHATTHLFPSSPLRALDVVQQLQQSALCMASVELPFSYRASPITPTTRLRSAEADNPADAVAGEMVTA